jgi:hypothetical protein
MSWKMVCCEDVKDIPGLYLWGFLTPPVDKGAVLRAALEASCLRGALPPVDLPGEEMC